MTDKIITRLKTAIRSHYGVDGEMVKVNHLPSQGLYIVFTDGGEVCLVGGIKQCTVCGEWKPHEDFYISNRNKDGMMHKCATCQSEYYRANKSRYDAYHAEYRRLYPEKRRASNEVGRNNRRARAKNVKGTIARADINEIKASQTDRKGRLICWECGKPIVGNKPPPHIPNGVLAPPHLDHWIPLALGGTNDPGNLHYMHGLCNMSKGAKHPTEIGRLV